MSPKHISVIAIVSGIIFVVVVYNTISEELAVILAFVTTVIIVAGLVLVRAFNKPDSFVEQLGEADILNRMWFPLQDELTDVVRTGGRVTESSSAWTAAPRLSKKETPTSFFREMEQYVRRRELVASFAASDLATEDSRQQLEAGQQSLLFMAQELHKEVNKAIEAIPGASAVRRTRSARPRPSYQRPQATATRPSPASSAETRQSTPVSRSAQARTATPARTIRAPPARARSHENRGYAHDVRTRRPHARSLGAGTTNSTERASSSVPACAYTAEHQGYAHAGGAGHRRARSS